MKITDECKEILLNAIKDNGGDSLRIYMTEVEQGKVLNMETYLKQDNDCVLEINGVNIVMDEETESALDHFIFDKDEKTGGLKLIHCCGHAHCHHNDENSCCDEDCCENENCECHK